jgi:hypothetical protein
MQLGYVDRVEKRTIHYLKRKEGELVIDYCFRFFYEIRGLGNILIMKDRRVISRKLC